MTVTCKPMQKLERLTGRVCWSAVNDAVISGRLLSQEKSLLMD